MQKISANVYPIRGQGRMAASILQGLGFDVFRIDAAMCIDGPPKLWQEVFGVTGPSADAVAIPDDLTGLLDRVVFIESRI